MDAASLTLSFGAPYVVTRRAVLGAGFDAHGQPLPPTPSMTFSIIASVQPASGRDLLRLPEARRALETRVLFTVTQLLDGGQGAAFEADRVSIDGQDWEVQQVQRWLGTPGVDVAYWRCIVQARQGIG